MARSKQADRISEVKRLWLQRPDDKRTENDVIAFYGWLEHNLPGLLDRRHGDPYQNLEFDLRNLIQSPQNR